MNKPDMNLSPAGIATGESYIPPLSRKEEPVSVAQDPSDLPEYLTKTYTWAYVNPSNVELLDHGIVVETILWGNGTRLMNWAFKEFSPGQQIMQPACVYGPFSRRLAEVVGPEGYLEVRDIQTVQIEHTRPKVAGLKQVSLKVADASEPVGRMFDGVCCFFLLHEVPDDWKERVVDSMLACVPPGGKVVFVDYHNPSNFHPLKLIMLAVNKFLEPYTEGLYAREIREFASRQADFTWTKETCFGGLYQKVVAVRKK